MLNCNRTIATSFNLIIILSVFFHQYSSVIPGITLGELLVILVCLTIVLVKQCKIQIKYTRELISMYAISLIFSIIAVVISNTGFHMVSQSEVFSRWIRYFAYMLFYVLICDNNLLLAEQINLVRIYKLFCVSIAIYTIIQFALHILIGVEIPANILPISFSREIVDTRTASNYYYRASGIFVEPSYLCSFLCPGLVFSFGEKNKDKLDLAVGFLVSIAIIVSTSVLGIIIWLFTVVSLFLSGNNLKVKKLFSNIIAIVLLLIIFVFIRNTGGFEQPFGRIVNLFSLENSIDRSSQLRLFRGYAFWAQLPIEYKFLGVGMGNAANYADMYNVVTSYDYYYRNAATLDYMNGISNILVCQGVVCLCFFVVFAFNLFHIADKRGKILLMQFVLSMLSGSSLYSFASINYVFFILYASRETALKDLG